MVSWAPWVRLHYERRIGAELRFRPKKHVDPMATKQGNVFVSKAARGLLRAVCCAFDFESRPKQPETKPTDGKLIFNRAKGLWWVEVPAIACHARPLFASAARAHSRQRTPLPHRARDHHN